MRGPALRTRSWWDNTHVMKSLARCMEENQMSVDQLVRETGLDFRLVEAIVRIAVQHPRGNGTQLGRST